MYKLLFIFAMLGLAFAAPAPQPQAPQLIYNTYPAPYLPGRVILNPAYANPGFANPALYPAGPIAYANY